MKYFQLLNELKRKNKQIEKLKNENVYLRNFGLLSLSFNVGFVTTAFISLMWDVYIRP